MRELWQKKRDATRHQPSHGSWAQQVSPARIALPDNQRHRPAAAMGNAKSRPQPDGGGRAPLTDVNGAPTTAWSTAAHDSTQNHQRGSVSIAPAHGSYRPTAAERGEYMRFFVLTRSTP